MWRRRTCCKRLCSLRRRCSERTVGVTLVKFEVHAPVITVVLKNSTSLKPRLSLSLDWDREKLLEAWMLDADGCCQRSGVAMPTPPPSGYNAWDTLPSPRTPKTPRSPLTLTLTSPTDSCLTPGEEGLSTVRQLGLTFSCFCLK